MKWISVFNGWNLESKFFKKKNHKKMRGKVCVLVVWQVIL